MNQSRLSFLFQAYFNKTATPAERDELMELLEQSENEGPVKDLLTNAWEQYASQSQLFNDSQGDEMLATILQRAPSNKPVIVMAPRPAFRWLRAAAAILLFVFAGGYFWLKSNQPTQQTVQSTKQPGLQPIVPGGNKAVLTLADGSHIVLDSTNQGILTKQGNAKIVNLNTSVLTYNAGNGNGRETVYNTLSTPKGGQYRLVLADGTKVWLNASSSIYYPVTFKGNERNVRITGEAYFEVAKNAAMPFNVTARDATVQVLGTHFNIMAYDDENSVNTTLLEGSVKVSKGGRQKVLVPGQQSIITQTGDIKVEEPDIEEVMAWKNGWFQFNGSDIEKVMRQVARWYDVDISYDGKIPGGHFTGMVNRENNISQVLEIMQAGGVNFKIEGHKVIVSKDRS